jgi:CRP/FNR family transcriptional regulator, nitrogen oxide reductase regulator
MRKAYYPDLSSARRIAAPERGRLEEAFRRNVPLFRRVPPAALSGLAAEAATRRYAKGSALCRPGDPARELWVLLDGRVHISRMSWKGGRVGIEIMLPGDVFGLPAIFSAVYPNEIAAARDSEVAAIPKAAALRAVEKCPELAREILLALGQRLEFMESQLVLSREDAEKRVVAALLYLCHKFGPKLPLTRAELSEMSGTTEETAIRIIQRLVRRGGLRKAAGALICDVAVLRGMLDDVPGRPS